MRLIFVVLAIYLMVFSVVEKQADSYAAVGGKAVFVENQAAIQMPDLPPLYLLSKESLSFETLTDSPRFHFQHLHATQLVPRDFSFRNTIRLTFCLIDHKAPIQGSAGISSQNLNLPLRLKS